MSSSAGGSGGEAAVDAGGDRGSSPKKGSEYTGGAVSDDEVSVGGLAGNYKNAIKRKNNNLHVIFQCVHIEFRNVSFKSTGGSSVGSG